MTVQQPRYSKEEFARRGDEIYERDIRPQVEADNKGKIVAIDIETGAWEMDCTRWLPIRSSVRSGSYGMITGNVNADHEPLIRLSVRDANGQEHQISLLHWGYVGKGADGRY